MRRSLVLFAVLATAACYDGLRNGIRLDESVVVTHDPIGRTPLAATMEFRTTGPSTARVRVLGDETAGYETPTARVEHAIPILGLFPGVTNQVELTLSGPEGVFLVDTFDISTDPLPDFLPEVDIVTANAAAMEPGWSLSTLSVRQGEDWRTVPIAFDEQGRIRWYMDLADDGFLVLPVEPLESGNLIAGAGERIFEYDWLGRHVDSWRIDGYNFHHDVVEMPGGDLLVAVDKDGLATIEDFALVVNRETGDILMEIDLRQMMDVSRRDIGGSDEDWLHVNSLWYDESDGGIIISALYQGVFKISREYELEWILAPHRGWGPAGVDGTGPETAPKLLTAVDDQGTPYAAEVQDGAERGDGFDWPFYQHAAMLTPSGTLLIFDNGVRRNFQDPGEAFSRGVEYAIDEEAMTVEQLWTYGEERGAEYRSRFISDIDYMPTTGNRLVMPGRTNQGSAWITEVTAFGEVVFDAEIQFNLEDGGDIVYRSERIVFPR